MRELSKMDSTNTTHSSCYRLCVCVERVRQHVHCCTAKIFYSKRSQYHHIVAYSGQSTSSKS